MKRWQIIIGLTLTFYLGMLAGHGLTTKGQAAPTVQLPAAKPVYVPSEEMRELGRQIGLTDQQLVATRAQFGLPRLLAGLEGLYNDGTIYVSVHANSYAQTLAYEYSHYQWQQMSVTQQDSLKPLLDQFLANVPAANEHLKLTVAGDASLGNTSAYYDEAHAIACTMASDYQLPAGLLAQCNSYLQRGAIPRSF